MRPGKGTVGSLFYTDSLSQKLEKTATTANTALLTIKDAADGFSENMKALQGNFFLRGYFKRKAKEKAKQADSTTVAASTGEDGLDPDLTEEELNDLIAEAQKALITKKKKP